ncbi:tandem-95 repeat protein [Nocardioides sp. LMS-CY]|uniref:Ig-like domain-containing protein n=1 Tax=Nocardioides sp. (strain LMS-CY) TaxID=2840457 RepID=UPI001C007EAF|nr:Ig-like domain-containing protein [Nocardioides sp. LMS-CY]QWF22429.1 tandem-95 repeat protein [Nocardioides sp. LMS-CY]
MTLPGRRRLGAIAVAIACALAPLALPSPAAAAKRAVTNDRYTGTEDTVLRVKAPQGVLANDRIRRDVRRLVVVKAPRHGTLKLGRRGALRYRPAPNWSGRDTFLYRAVDRQGRRNVAVVRIEIKPVDDPTTTVDDVATVLEDGVVTGNVLANDSDIDSKLAILEHNASRAPGSFTIRPNGDWTYAPAADWNGLAVVGYATTTGALGTLRITVTPVDDPTVVVDDFAAAVAGGPMVTGNVLSNDIDVDSALSVVDDAFSGPGDWGIDPDGTWRYTPDPVEGGIVTVTYTTNTGAVGTLRIEITAPESD